MLRLSDIMTRDVITVTPDVTLREVLQLFADNHVSGAPVLAGSEIVGVVSVSDLIDISAMAPDLEPTARPARDRDTSSVLDEATVYEVMTRYPIFRMRSEAPVPAAADCMRQNGIHRILVEDDGRLTGIVTAWDIANAVADRRLNTRTVVFGQARELDERGWWTEWLLDDPYVHSEA
jgi:CBS domain-containing protein